MKTYSLWLHYPEDAGWHQSIAEPYTFTTLEDAHVEAAIRTFTYGYQYKIMESEEQQS